MKKPKQIATLAVIVLVCAVVGTHFILLDGLDGFFWSRMFKEDTRYAEGYSDAAFRKVRVGMKESELRQLLVDPLRRYPPDPESSRDWSSLWFSESPTSGHFRMRSVNLRDGIVIGKHAEFYVD